MRDSLERRVLEAIDGEALLDILSELISIQSVGVEETPARERRAELMQAIGLEVETWPLPGSGTGGSIPPGRRPSRTTASTGGAVRTCGFW